MHKVGNRRRNPVSDEAIISFYKDVHSVYIVEKTLGVAASTIYRVLERNGIERTGLAEYRRKNTRFLPEVEVQIRERYQAGSTYAEIVREFGGTQYSVRRAIERTGQAVEPVTPPLTDEEVEQIVALHETGMSQLKISINLKRSQSSVSRLLRKHGYEHEPQVGSSHSSWKGGRWVDGNGYVKAWVSVDDPLAPMRDRSGYVSEHRLVVARKLNRVLARYETVHHINGDRTDNRFENLQLRQGKHGKGVVLCCLDCGSRNIGPADLH